MNDVLLQNAAWGFLGAVLVALIGAASIQLKGWLDRRDTRRDTRTVTEATLRQSNIEDSRNLRAELMKMLEVTQADVRDLTEQLKQERTTRVQESEAHKTLLDTERAEREQANVKHAAQIKKNGQQLLTVRSRLADLRTQVQRVGDLVMALDAAGKRINPAAWMDILIAATGTPELPPLPHIIGDEFMDLPPGSGLEE